MITTWRICPAQRARGAFSGDGARLYGGRWNSPGVRLIYTSATRSLAALEVLVHTDDPSDLAALNYVVIPVEIPERHIREVAALPRSWWVYPALPANARLGGRWIESGASPVLRVPSAAVRAEWNYLLNPAHPAFGSLRIGKAERFAFDSRLAVSASGKARSSRTK